MNVHNNGWLLSFFFLFPLGPTSLITSCCTDLLCLLLFRPGAPSFVAGFISYSSMSLVLVFGSAHYAHLINISSMNEWIISKILPT